MHATNSSKRAGKRATVTQLIPPFMYLLGSGNRRLWPGASFDAGLLARAGYDVRVVHADCPPAGRRNAKWLELFRRSDGLENGAARATFEQIWPAIADRISRTGTETVIVHVRDWVEAAKDISDVQIALEVGRRLKTQMGLRTVAVGGLATRFSALFAESFDAVLVGPPGNALIRAVEGRNGILKGEGPAAYADVEPKLDGSDVPLNLCQVSSESGCPWGTCRFCAIASMYGPGTTARPVQAFVQDVGRRPESQIQVVDTCFGWNPERLRAMAAPLGALGKALVVSTRAEYALRPEMLDLFREAGVATVKIGVESLSDTMLARMHKGQSADEVTDRLVRLHEAGFEVFAYLLLGSEGETPRTLGETLARARSLDFVQWLPNVFCALDDSSPVAHHFSRPQARRLGLPDDLVAQFFELSACPRVPVAA